MVHIQGPDKILLAKKNQKTIQIYLDIDGVLAFWLKPAAKACGLDIEEKELREQLKGNEQLDEIAGITEEKMWQSINKEGTQFWENLELFSWSKELYNTLNEMGDLTILTSPGKRADTAALAAGGKIPWIDKHFHTYKYVIAYNKDCCAMPNALLIDDSDKKIASFAKAGGQTFFWPNCLKLIDGDIDVEKTIEELKQKLEKYKEGI